MPEPQLECVVRCPKCGEDKFEVWRVPLDSEGHYAHRTVPEDISDSARRFCVCGTMLERK